MLTDLFALDMSAWEKVARTIGVYLGLLVLLRVFGKRLMAQMNSQDLVVVLLLSNVVQNAVIGTDNSLIGGLLGAVVLVVANWLIDVIAHRFPAVDVLLSGRATPVVTHGVPDRAALRDLSITESELGAALRHQGADAVSEVRSATIEPGGSVLVDLEPSEQNLSRGEFAAAIESLREHLDTRIDQLATDRDR
ncbi:DUF421 domain-containing protein [Brachybacterium sp. AOP25-B2-12]|uniref:DUF421 domain-containing protein n=1 Tax=Brachybacterium sp. AOP25-B2-12 TaxID=3457710 RepID=UPI0040344829